MFEELIAGVSAALTVLADKLIDSSRHLINDTGPTCSLGILHSIPKKNGLQGLVRYNTRWGKPSYIYTGVDAGDKLRTLYCSHHPTATA